VEVDSTNEPRKPTIESDKGQLSNNVTKSLNPYRSDEDLGDLDWRFSADNGRFTMDEEVCHLNSQVLVIMDPDNEVEHVLHGSRLELYLADNLGVLDHSFKNIIEVHNVQTNPIRSIHCPQGQDDFTVSLSVVQSTGALFHQFFKDLNFFVPKVIKFVLNHDCNVAQDGDLKHGNRIVAEDSEGDGEPTAEPVQCQQVMFGCCSQASCNKYVEGHCAPLPMALECLTRLKTRKREL
jgi:hypothetical protein